MEEAKQETKTLKQLVDEENKTIKQMIDEEKFQKSMQENNQWGSFFKNYIQFCNDAMIQKERNKDPDGIRLSDFWAKQKINKQNKESFFKEAHYTYKYLSNEKNHKYIFSSHLYLFEEITSPATCRIASPYICLNIKKHNLKPNILQILNESFEKFDCTMIENCKLKICKTQDDEGFCFVLFFNDKNFYSTEYNFIEPNKVHCFKLKHNTHPSIQYYVNIGELSGCNAIAVGYNPPSWIEDSGYTSSNGIGYLPAYICSCGKHVGQTQQHKTSVAVGTHSGQTQQHNTSVAVGTQSSYNSVGVGVGGTQNGSIAMGIHSSQTEQHSGYIVIEKNQNTTSEIPDNVEIVKAKQERKKTIMQIVDEKAIQEEKEKNEKAIQEEKEWGSFLKNYVQFCNDEIIQKENDANLEPICFNDFWVKQMEEKKIINENNKMFFQEKYSSYEDLKNKSILNFSALVNINILFNEITSSKNCQIASPFVILRIAKFKFNSNIFQSLDESFEKFDCSMIENCKLKICKAKNDSYFYFVLFFNDKEFYPTQYDFTEPNKIHRFNLEYNVPILRSGYSHGTWGETF